jgi:crotonobetainyl-CoA:carnitine CoA-transferase CaiB-like acyl-CoA transferase
MDHAAARPAAAAPPAHRPLEGVRVLDLTRYLPGPFCALHLAWLGAEVTVVEQPPHGDPMRAIPPVDEEGVSLAYRSLRRDASEELLDLGRDDGRARALELADAADVFLESFRPGVAARLGVGPEQLRERNPGLVYCSLSGYGQDGPWAQAPGHDMNYEAISGLLEQNGTHLTVVPPAVPIADLAGGLSAATAICAALVRRATAGTGCTLDISLTESALAMQAMHLPGATAPTGTARGAGTLTGGLACYHPYRCADGQWLSVGPIEPKFFATLCDALERPELAELQYDPTQQEFLIGELETIFAARSAHEWETLLVGADGGGSCVALALHPSDVAEHPQLAARGAVLELPGAGDAHMPASPYVVDGVRSDERVTPAALR